MTEVNRRWVEARGGQSVALATESVGCGQPFVWGHSLMGSMAQDFAGGVLAWRELADVAQVIRFDARGHGQSGSEGEPQDYRWDNLARNMWQVADSYTEEKVILGGASMGSAAALYAACQRPEQVKGLVLVIPPTAWELRRRMKRNYRVMARIVELTCGLPLRLLRFIPDAKEGDSFHQKMLATLAGELPGANPRGVAGALRGASLSDLPSLEELEKLSMPVLILAWPDDTVHPLSVAEQLHSRLQNSQLEVAQHPDDPYRWPKLVRDFISSQQ